jgi:hypothetical protein
LTGDKNSASMGWASYVHSEAVSDPIKTVKEREATKTGLHWTAEHP